MLAIFDAGMNVSILSFVQTCTRFTDCNKTGKIMLFTEGWFAKESIQICRVANRRLCIFISITSLGKVLFILLLTRFVVVRPELHYSSYDSEFVVLLLVDLGPHHV